MSVVENYLLRMVSLCGINAISLSCSVDGIRFFLNAL